MPVIAFAGLEPKSGKSTCAVLVASALTNRGGRVLLVDADPKQDALAWSNKARARELKVPTAIAAPNAAALVADLGARFDLTIVDLPTEALAQQDVCKVADVVVVVMSAKKKALETALDGLDDDVRERAVYVVTRAPAPDARGSVAATFVVDTAFASTVSFGTVATHGDLGDLVATVEMLASVVARRADVFDFEVTGDIPQPFVRIEIPSLSSPAASSAADETKVVDTQQFLRDMDTFVGVIERSFLDTLSSSSASSSSGSSTDESPATARERLRDGLAAARHLLGMHFENGETFVVNDGTAFFDVAIAADRVIATANGLLDDMERKSETTVMRPSIDALARQVKDLVTQLRELRAAR